MNWFDTSGITNLAKNALKEAQKTLDKALDIQDVSEEEDSQTPEISKEAPGTSADPNSSDFFASWGLTVSAEGNKEEEKKESLVVTESPSKAGTAGLWGSFAGSFFDPTKSEDVSAIVKPPKAKSMNVIADYDSPDDLLSQNQLIMSSGGEMENKERGHKEDVHKIEDRRSSSRSTGLSLISSSDSVEVLSHSMKSTPDSEAVSAQSDSLSCSLDKKLNSESVEILPDSLVSPSSIECIGFDSYSSDRNSTPSSHLTPDDSEKKTPVGDVIEKHNTADSVSLVADDDDDTVSYNSVSECTAPTVLDTDEKTCPFTKPVKVEPRKLIDRDLMHLDSMQRMQFSENSSNDGSWSDRTLNADNDSVTLEEDKKKVLSETEDVIMDKLSDSSSFYNIPMSTEFAKSESSAFVNVEKQHCDPDSNPSSQKDTVKERTSPVSSSSKSDLVKIGSDRTSGHTSGDELETATSSDIEIIPSPNGDTCRNSPSKYGGKLSKLDGMAPNLVDLVLGKSLATKIRGHNRELSEASVQSAGSDDSQSSENDKLMRRLCEMAEVLESRESKLIEVSRNNADLSEYNENLKRQMESLMAKNDVGDINSITEEYTQRMSALEKKFQQAIKEKDQIRKQLETVRTETSRRTSSEFENIVKEKDDMIAQLQEEGEKLSRQQLQHSNIIKKLRAKEKDNEQVLKSLRDKISEQTSELDRLKRSLAMKEEVEVSQIEAVYRLTTSNKKLDADYLEAKSLLEDALQRYESAQVSLDVTKRELSELQRASSELARRNEINAQLASEREQSMSECERLRAQLQQLRSEMMQEERRWSSREEALRREVESARVTRLADDESSRSLSSQDAHAHAALLAQLSSMQRALLRKDSEHSAHMDALQEALAEKEAQLTKSQERERLSREEARQYSEQVLTSRGLIDDAQARLKETTEQWHAAQQRWQADDCALRSKISELERQTQSLQSQLSEVQKRLTETEALLERERSNVDTERKRNAILQEQLSARGDVSPTQSLASDTLSNSLWTQEELPPSELSFPSSGGVFAVEELLSTAQRHSSANKALHNLATSLARERDSLTGHVARLTEMLQDQQTVREQYDALLEMYGEKEEQLAELRLDLADVTQLYKQQLDELVALRQQVAPLK